ncbi:hypothetical protein KAR91_12075 [Candidatus Pacearchaeota archaeon]|nr:hypothetical protein [Candidatus Pacearchaeota archaeon]
MATLNCHYPESKHTPNTLNIISADWFEAFASLSEYQFKELMKLAKKKCKFSFPKIADLGEEAEYLANKTINNEFLFCGFCVGSIAGCKKMYGEHQAACDEHSYHGGSPLGLKRLKEKRSS